MPRLITGISSAVALSLISGAAISGAAELARGRDLLTVTGGLTPVTQALAASSSAIDAASPVNRGSKADRATAVSGSPESSRTVSLKLDSILDTTVLVRIPVAAASQPTTARMPAKPAMRKPMVACEPVVSPLTEVAKRLEPGRCIS